MDKILKSTSGMGVKNHIRTIGKFEVRYLKENIVFNILEDAHHYFTLLDEEAELWDVTAQAELIESKYYNK